MYLIILNSPFLFLTSTSFIFAENFIFHLTVGVHIILEFIKTLLISQNLRLCRNVSFDGFSLLLYTLVQFRTALRSRLLQ